MSQDNKTLAKYIDISKTNTSDNDIICKINNYIDGSFDLNGFSKLSLVKMDLNVSELRLFRVILKQPQEFIQGKQNKGYYETIYKIKLSFINENNEIEEYEEPIYFYNYENPPTTNNNINSQLQNGSNQNLKLYKYDNFNNYFSVYSMENFNRNINRTIQELAQKYFIKENELGLLKTLPIINTLNNKTCIYTCYNGDENNTIKYYNNIEDLTNDKIKNSYTFGFNYYLNVIYYKPFMVMNKNNYYYLNNNYVKSDLDKININVNGSIENYYVQTLENTQYVEYVSDIKSILLSTSIKTNSYYVNVKDKNFEIVNNSNNELLTNSGLNVFSRLNIDNDKEKTTRIIYSNTNLTNNAVSILNNSSIQNINIDLYLIDKFDNVEYLTLHPLDTLYIQLVLF